MGLMLSSFSTDINKASSVATKRQLNCSHLIILKDCACLLSVSSWLFVWLFGRHSGLNLDALPALESGWRTENVAGYMRLEFKSFSRLKRNSCCGHTVKNDAEIRMPFFALSLKPCLEYVCGRRGCLYTCCADVLLPLRKCLSPHVLEYNPEGNKTRQQHQKYNKTNSNAHRFQWSSYLRGILGEDSIESEHLWGS